MRIQQDARLYASLLGDGQAVSHIIAKGRKGWLHVVKGAAELNGRSLGAGDGVAIDAATGDEALAIRGKDAAELLLFDMAA